MVCISLNAVAFPNLVQSYNAPISPLVFPSINLKTDRTLFMQQATNHVCINNMLTIIISITGTINAHIIPLSSGNQHLHM